MDDLYIDLVNPFTGSELAKGIMLGISENPWKSSTPASIVFKMFHDNILDFRNILHPMDLISGKWANLYQFVTVDNVCLPLSANLAEYAVRDEKGKAHLTLGLVSLSQQERSNASH